MIERIQANAGSVALRYGALVYNVEAADQSDISKPLGAGPLKAEWRPDLLGGVTTLNGTWQDGTPMVAIPNYAGMHRLDHAPVEFAGDDRPVHYAPGATAGSTPATNTASNRQFCRPPIISQVWTKDHA